VTTQKNYFPGYVLAKMFLTDETWNLIKNSPRVTSLLGNKNFPTPISEAEINRILVLLHYGCYVCF
jgi:transcriptional antiterminator NusG